MADINVEAARKLCEHLIHEDTCNITSRTKAMALRALGREDEADIVEKRAAVEREIVLLEAAIRELRAHDEPTDELDADLKDAWAKLAELDRA